MTTLFFLGGGSGDDDDGDDDPLGVGLPCFQTNPYHGSQLAMFRIAGKVFWRETHTSSI